MTDPLHGSSWSEAGTVKSLPLSAAVEMTAVTAFAATLALTVALRDARAG